MAHEAHHEAKLLCQTRNQLPAEPGTSLHHFSTKRMLLYITWHVTDGCGIQLLAQQS